MSSRLFEAVDALRTQYATIPFAWPVLYKNKNNYQPVVGTPYVVEDIVGATTRDDALTGATRWRKTVGKYQLLLCVPLNDGSKRALDYADTVEDVLTRATGALSMALADGTPVIVSDVTVGAERIDPKNEWVQIPVVFTFTYIAH